MDDVIAVLVSPLLDGGRPIIAILVIVLAMLLLDRWRILRSAERREQRMDAIIDQYHKGNLALVDALNSLKLLLYEIRTKL